jgi:O-antigen/teichoic acid export membrane protein
MKLNLYNNFYLRNSDKAKSTLDSKIRNIGKETFWVGFGQILSALGPIFGVKILTHLMTPKAYGELAIAMSAAVFMMYMVRDSLGNAAMRFYSIAAEQNRIIDYIWSLKKLFQKITIFFTLFCSLGILILWLWGWKHIALLGIPIAILSYFLSTNSLLEYIQIGARQRIIVAFHQALLQWSRYLLAALLVYFTVKNATVALWGFAAAGLIVVISQGYFLNLSLKPAIKTPAKISSNNGETFKIRMIQYAAPLIISSFFTWLFMFADRWSLVAFRSANEVGLYFALYQIGFFPTILFSKILLQVVSPILYEKAGDGIDQKRMNMVFKTNLILTGIVIILSVFAALILFMIHTQVFNLLVAKEYRAVSWLLPWITLSGGLYAAGQIPLISIMSGDSTVDMIPMKVITILFGCGCYVLGSYLYGLPGVVFGGLTFSAIHLIWAFGIHKNKEKEKLQHTG